MQTFLFGKRIERRVKYRRYQFILYIKYIDFPIFTDNEDTSIDIDFYETKPLRAASYIPTPERYKHAKCGLINIQNPDQECFKWNALYHQTPKGKHDDRLSVLKKVVDKYKWDGINFPASYEDVYKFEELNQICVFIYGLDNRTNIYCDKKGNSKYILNDCMYLLRVKDKEHAHYIYIKHIDRFFSCTSSC